MSQGRVFLIGTKNPNHWSVISDGKYGCGLRRKVVDFDDPSLRDLYTKRSKVIGVWEVFNRFVEVPDWLEES